MKFKFIKFLSPLSESASLYKNKHFMHIKFFFVFSAQRLSMYENFFFQLKQFSFFMCFLFQRKKISI